MIRWELDTQEARQLTNILRDEDQRLSDVLRLTQNDKTRVRAEAKRAEISRLLKSLRRAQDATEGFDLLCYCDVNYEFSSKTLSVSYRIGDEQTAHKEDVIDIQPPPDEYLGIQLVLKELKRRGLKGSVLVVVDASRCAIALQMGMRYKVPKHSENQSPRNVNFGFSYDETIRLVKELLAEGCRVEFTYRNRGYINEALRIA